MKKTIKYILLTLLGLFVGLLILMVAYPFWMMQASPRPEQPELSPEEVIFFNRLEKELNVKIERTFYIENYSSEKIDTFLPYSYSLRIITNRRKDHIETSKYYNKKIAYYIKDSILNKSKNIIEIDIFWTYSDGKNSLNHTFKNDTIINKLVPINEYSEMTE